MTHQLHPDLLEVLTAVDRLEPAGVAVVRVESARAMLAACQTARRAA